MVQWLQGDPRFELTTVHDYLDRFPPDPAQAAHIEPGSWSGADNGDPQFMKWFSRYDQPYSPDLNSWAVLTAFQNVVHALEDAVPGKPWLDDISRLMLTAETSCYWYWTGQHIWDQQVTNAANMPGYGMVKSEVDALLAAGKDRTGPTIFAPWVTPENPGGKRWGQGCLLDAPREGTCIPSSTTSRLKRVTLVLRDRQGEIRLADDRQRPVSLTDRGRHRGALLHRPIAGRRRRCALLHRGGGRKRQRLAERAGAGVSGLKSLSAGMQRNLDSSRLATPERPNA
jgi:hypothetical protein